NLVLGGSFNFNLDAADLTLDNIWSIIDVASLNETFTDTFSVTGFAEESAGVWTNGVDLVFSETTGVLSVIPEPSVLAMFACGFGIIGFWRRSILRKA
ncbi:MAG: hypothetical protein PHP93_08910, partial [Kiritimatiellales bacterium]|nr:hypothetical protein [Kiritimatiellales bacterium]